jgi:hypothetical protein
VVRPPATAVRCRHPNCHRIRAFSVRPIWMECVTCRNKAQN